MILGNRFGLWYTPRVEQAGAQPKRGCEEQILTIRLLMDIARKTKKVLYLAFIDYRQAYDRVNRHKLLQYLASTLNKSYQTYGHTVYMYIDRTL